MNPTAEQADIVLPVASAFETEGLRVGFRLSPAASREAPSPRSRSYGSSASPNTESQTAKAGFRPKSVSTMPMRAKSERPSARSGGRP